MNTNEKIEAYLLKHPTWLPTLTRLRNIMIEMSLEETYKWSAPVYTCQGKNLLSIGATKHYCGVWFFQGGLLKDEKKVLMNAQEGKTKAMRQWRFTNETELNAELLKSYIKESIKYCREGIEIKPNRKQELIIPPELNNVLTNNQELQIAFNQLGLSKQRDFAEYIETAKQEKTKLKRIEKIIPMIKSGVGLNDKYK